MDQTEKIFEFLDGNLSAEEERSFLAEMSSNDDLRSELREQLAIKDAIKSDTKAYTPMASSTVNIFSELGFNAPAAAIGGASAGVGVTAIKSGGVAALFSKYSQGIIGGLFAGVATAVVIFLLLDPIADSESSSDLVYSGLVNSEEIPNSTSFENEQLQETSNIFSEASDIKMSPLKEKVIIKKVYIPIEKDDSEEDNFTQDELKARSEVQNNLLEISYLEEEDDIVEKFAKSIFNSSQMNKYRDHVPGPQYTPFDLSNFQAGRSLFSLELRGTQDWFTQNPENNGNMIQPSSEQIFNDYGVSLFYNFNDDWKIGIDYRRENFFQKYEGITDNGLRAIYEQQPNFESFGLTVRHNANWIELFDVVVPIAQVSVGGNTAGYILRGMGGFHFRPFSGVSMVLGMEYSNLWFEHRGNSFTSPKWGLNYGLSFEF